MALLSMKMMEETKTEQTFSPTLPDKTVGKLRLTMPNNTEQCLEMRNNAEQCRAMPSNAKQCQVMPSNAKQCQEMPSNTEI